MSLVCPPEFQPLIYPCSPVGVDVFYSPIDDTYMVNVDEMTGVHHVSIDPKYPYSSSSSAFEPSKRRKRQANETANAGNSSLEKVYLMEERMTKPGFHSFITVAQSDTFLVVRQVRHRLVITLPNTVHNLKIARFFLVLRGAAPESSGAVFFRQDQPHIDLFVFFSVFFSCFFLFLAVCVLLWKTKQMLDTQRSRHQRRLEMEHMASRPFARALVAIDTPTAPDSPKPQPQKKPKHSASKYLLAPPDDGLHLNYLALEPTDDGVAAVGTFFFQLPGGTSAPVKACLGSALLTMRVMYPNHQHLLLSKNTLSRNSRRPSSVST